MFFGRSGAQPYICCAASFISSGRRRVRHKSAEVTRRPSFAVKGSGHWRPGRYNADTREKETPIVKSGEIDTLPGVQENYHAARRDATIPGLRVYPNLKAVT